MDFSRVPHPLFQTLEEKLPGMVLESCDDWLQHQRIIKTDGEIQLLKYVAYTTDHAINGRFHHIISNQLEINAQSDGRCAGSLFGAGLDEIGYHSTAQAVSGEKSKLFWPHVNYMVLIMGLA